MNDSALAHFRAALFAQAGLPMVILDPSGRILDWNRAAEWVLGYGHGEAVGRSALLARRPEDARKLELLLKRTVRERRLADFETFVTRRDGTELPVAMSVCPLADEHGDVVAVGVVLRDRRRQKALERRLAEHEKMVAIGRLAGGLSHYIGNILAAMSARVELALATGDANSSQQALHLTAEGIERLANITRNLLLFSGAERRRPTTCRPESIVRKLVDHLRSEIAGEGVALVAALGPTPAVRLDAGELEQLVENLLLNARQAVAAPGTISVELADDRTGTVLAVCDTGEGIPGEDIPHVFDPFWTTRGSLVGGTGGALGLGLTVVHSLTTSAGGSVDIESEPGHGTTVTVRLPAVEDAPSPGEKRRR